VQQARLDTGWLTEGSHGGLTVAVFGGVEPVDLPMLRRMQHQAGSALAIAVDVDAWVGSTAESTATTRLGQQGWRAVSLGPRDRLDSVWQELGRMSAHSSRGVVASREVVR
jgi:hypothetical protein